MKNTLLLFLFFLSSIVCFGEEIKYKTISDIPYYPENIREKDAYLKERCVLDIYYPESLKDFPVIIWFHGGGLTGGKKSIPEALKEKGFCVVAVNYRLHPHVKCPAYIEDAATSIAWVFKNIHKYGGNTKQIIVSGHSAGAYLTGITGMDKRWLEAHDIDANDIAALFILSSNAITHMTIRKEKGIPDTQPLIDEYSIAFHIRPDTPPVYLMTGDRELEMLGRYEENAYLWRMMKIIGNKNVFLYEFDGYGHDMLAPAFPLMIKHIREAIK